MFKTVEDIKNYQRKLRPSNDNFIFYYLNTIYQILLMREESPNADINDFNNKNIFSNTQKQKANEKGISFRNFLQYIDIQEFMCERIFNYLDKTKTGKLSKNEFVNGLYIIFFGNVTELTKIAFYICDFNQNNKIHKFNMKLILSYIPVNTYEEQQEYIKKINSIINNYFAEIDKKYPEKNINIDKEIDYDLYKSSIDEYIKNNTQDSNFNNNGSFLLFINLISYIYLNHPFIIENMNYCDFIKNKFLIKVQHIKKSQLNNFEKTNHVKFAVNSVNQIAKDSTEKLPKVSKKNRSNSLHVSKNLKVKSNEKKSDKKLTNLSDEELNIINGKKENAINLKSSKNYSEEFNKAKGNNSKNKVKDVGPFKLTPKRKNTTKSLFKKDNIDNDNDEEEDILVIEEDKNTDNNNISANNKNEDEYCDLLFKYCEEDNSKYIKKYYAILKGKEILFFTSKLKNELCSIWSISKTIIIIKEKTNIGKYSYFPIQFINYNRSYYMLYFEEQEKQKNFAKICEKNTNFLKIGDLFEFKEKIGEGHFGVVKKCIEKSTGKEYAVKIMNKNKIKEKDLNFLIQERNYMCLIKHPNIVSLVRDFEDEKCIYFVMEYFKGGDLAKYLGNISKKEKNLEKLAAKIIKIIAQGVQYLNQFGIVHRDLKPENIVFEKEDDIKSIKIIDLGVAITLPYGKQSADPIGTLAFIAPEMYTHNSYSYKVDVWSIGILLYYLVSGGVLPFDDEKMDESILGKKIVFTHQEYPEKYFGDKSKSLISLIDKTLEKNPEKRISIGNFLKEEWLNKFSK
jgi:tRNA A-37 threonylcarbamoyl transferase component Bud32